MTDPEAKLAGEGLEAIPYEEYEIEVFDGLPLTLIVVRGEEIVPGTLQKLKDVITSASPTFVGVIIGVPPGLSLDVYEEPDDRVRN